MATLTGLHHGALSVSDMDASVRWYSDVLGLEPTFRQEHDDRQVAVMTIPGSRQSVGLVSHKGGGAAFNPHNIGLDHLALSVASGEELAAWARQFDERGMKTSGVIETPFGGMLHLADPDGIALALFWEQAPPAPPPAH